MNLNKRKILNLQNVDNSEFSTLCQAYSEHVSYWNTITNLISTGDVDNLLTNLIVQSVTPLFNECIPQAAKLLDVGSGAGIPALPIKFARPDVHVVMLEPRRKKASFLRRVVDELALQDVTIEKKRLEDAKDNHGWEQHFDLITTRGTGHSPSLFQQIQPLVKPGGSIWFYKGVKAKKEAAELSEMTTMPVDILEIDQKLSLIIVRF